MPELAPVVLNDGTNAINFTVDGRNQQVGQLIARGSTPGVYHSLSVGRTGSEATGYKTSIRMSVPSVATVGSESLTVVDFVEINFKLDALGTTTSRGQLRQLVASLMGSTMIQAMIDDKEGLY